MRFSVKSVSTGKLYFAVWSGSIQSPYNLADLSKIHPIVRFDTWNIPVHLTDPISGGRGVKPAVQKAHNKWPGLCAIGENCRGVWRAGQKLRFRTKDRIFQSNLLHRALIQNRPKTGKNVDFSDRTRFFENISRAKCSSHRQASKTPLFGNVYPAISIRNLFKTDPPRF